MSSPDVPDRSRDDTDIGWGERPHDEDEDEAVRRLLEEKPPHHTD